jgi:hypothetical protein
LPNGAVVVPISAPRDLLETQLVWRSENENPALAAFITVARGVFADSGQPSAAPVPKV